MHFNPYLTDGGNADESAGNVGSVYAIPLIPLYLDFDTLCTIPSSKSATYDKVKPLSSTLDAMTTLQGASEAMDWRQRKNLFS